MQDIIVVGTGGLAREFTSWCQGYFNIIAYSTTNPSEHAEFKLLGKVYDNEITPELVATKLAVIAVGTPSLKAKIYERLSLLGFEFPTFIHASSVISNLATIKPGVIIAPNCVIGPNAILETMVYLNFGSGIGHDTTVGRFTQINPGVQIGGCSTVGESVLVGSGATILQDLTIGNKATIASGSVVFSNVAASATVMGNPAKRMFALEKQD
jgi:sugar O-acyltransferase (sialic acid O-acetyltransferase NeuD family)